MKDRNWDVCVCGGGIAGIAAAIAAARTGAKTCLLEKEYAPGGLATLGLVVIYLPLDDGDGTLMSGGLAEELIRLSWKYAPVHRLPPEWTREATPRERAGKRYQTEFSPAAMILACEELLLSSGVTIFYDARVTDVHAGDGQVRSVTVAGKRGPELFRAKTFVDCTGDADLCYFAGEPTVDDAQNVRTCWNYTYNGHELQLHMLSDTMDVSRLPAGSRTYCGTTLEDISASVIDGRCAVIRQLERMREADPDVYPFIIPAFHGLRMTRRLKSPGEELTAGLHERVWFSDAVGMIGNWTCLHERYSIPFRAIHASVNDNLYAAGRACAAEKSGWNLTRVIPSCAVTGEAAGTAAGMQALSGHVPEISSLQDTLRRSGVLLRPELFTRVREA